MASPSPNAENISAALSRLTNLPTDRYVISFGPDGKQFIGTPNGYAATYVPSSILEALSKTNVQDVIWVSFGGTPESWFFVYQAKNGNMALRLGDDTPKQVFTYMESFATSPSRIASCRVQLGSAGSFVVWCGKSWTCHGIPSSLYYLLFSLSVRCSSDMKSKRGATSQGTIEHVQWHADGSYYLKSGGKHYWSFQTAMMQEQWTRLWQDRDRKDIRPEDLNELAYVAIDSHAPTCETFTFIMKQGDDKDAPFVLHFPDEPVYARLRDIKNTEDKSQQVRLSDQNIPFRWANAKRSGKPHPRDEWELTLRKDQKVKVFEHIGRDWHMVVDGKGARGLCHGSWLAFESEQVQLDKKKTDNKTAFARFDEEFLKRLASGQLRKFPLMTSYTDICTQEGCKPLKDDMSSLGICVHDLKALLEGYVGFTVSWVKEGRNMWHPDRFARFCAPDCVADLKPKAEQMFVLYGILMELAQASEQACK